MTMCDWLSVHIYLCIWLHSASRIVNPRLELQYENGKKRLIAAGT
jgi:hypothetical protein